MRPRHVFVALVLSAQAPILAALIAGWLISGLIYAVALGVERAHCRVRAGRELQRRARRTPSAASPRAGGLRVGRGRQRIGLEPARRS